MGTNHDKIVKIDFHFSNDKIFSQRLVFTFYEWIGSMGGVTNILNFGANFFIGGFLSFNMTIELIIELYSKDQDLLKASHEENSHKNMNIS